MQRTARTRHPKRALLLVVLAACGKGTPPPVPRLEPSATTVPTSGAAPAPAGCGPMDCRQFDTLRDAFAAALEGKPLVVAVGEAHAQRGKEGILSSAKRFTEEVLPLFQGRASDLIVELMMPARLPDGGACVTTAVSVKEKQQAVTRQQQSTNQSEYVTMGNRARALGIIPDLLRPTCDDLAAIDRAGDDMIDVSLQTIKRLTAAKVIQQLERNEKTPADQDKMVITYGGALHNDLVPPAERAAWSFGPELSKRTGGRYVEIDLYVSDFIEDTETWKKLEWYPHWDKRKLGGKVTMFKPRDSDFVIITASQK